jgi:hypothetical protein
VAVAAIKGEKTLIELAQDFDVDPNQIKQWRDQLLEGATGVFGEAPKTEPEPTIHVKTLHAKIGALTLDFIKELVAREIKISIDGNGAWRDNVFVERLWRTIKYEEVNQRAYASVSEALAGIGRYLTFYNGPPPALIP